MKKKTRMIELRWNSNSSQVKVYIVIEKRGKHAKAIFLTKSPVFQASSVPQSVITYTDSLFNKFPADDKVIIIEWGDGMNNFIGASRLRPDEVIDIVRNEVYKSK